MKRIVLALIWISGSAAAMTIAWTGANFVDDQIIEPLPATLVSADCADADNGCSTGSRDAMLGNVVPPTAAPDSSTSTAEQASSTSQTSSETSEPATSSVSTPTPAATQSPTTTGAATPTTIASAGTTAPTATAPRSTTSAGSTGTTAASGPVTSTTARPTTTATTTTTPTTTATTTTTPSASTSTSTTSPPASAQTFTFDMIGGTTAISFSPNGVVLLWASPKPGFNVEVSHEDGGQDVDFRSDNHRSKLDAWWEGGPQWFIQEIPDKSGGGGGNGDDLVGSTTSTTG